MEKHDTSKDSQTDESDTLDFWPVLRYDDPDFQVGENDEK